MKTALTVFAVLILSEVAVYYALVPANTFTFLAPAMIMDLSSPRMGLRANLELTSPDFSLLRITITRAVFFILVLVFLRCPAVASSPHPILPNEATLLMNGPSGPPCVTLQLRSGKQLVAMVDTGSRSTILDESLNSELGTPVGNATVAYPGIKRARANVFKAELYLGGVQLLTGGRILTAPRDTVAILGMDCLRHYCVQLDLSAKKIRFLDPDQALTMRLGKAIPISISPWTGYVGLREDFLGCKAVHWIVDTGGGGVDALLNPKLFAQSLLRYQVSSAAMGINGVDTRGAIIPEARFAGESYSDLVVGELRRDIWPTAPNVLGLRFLARHLVTFDFPKRVMYLRRIVDQPQN